MTSEANVILHIGAGSFHRAHQAWYLHRLIESGDATNKSWSLAVGNIRGDMNAVLDALAAQHGEYTLETVTPKGEREYETIRGWIAAASRIITGRGRSVTTSRSARRTRRSCGTPTSGSMTPCYPTASRSTSFSRRK